MQIRSLVSADYEVISPVVDEWWGGRPVRHLVHRLFFEHFSSTSFALAEDGELCAFLIGLAAAFLAGVMVARHTVTERETNPPVNLGNAGLPNPFSPNPTHDPYFIDQERKNVEALERTCRRTGRYCNEAAQMRRWLAESSAAR